MLITRSCATYVREPCQGRDTAALNGAVRVPQGCFVGVTCRVNASVNVTKKALTVFYCKKAAHRKMRRPSIMELAVAVVTVVTVVTVVAAAGRACAAVLTEIVHIEVVVVISAGVAGISVAAARIASVARVASVAGIATIA